METREDMEAYWDALVEHENVIALPLEKWNDGKNEHMEFVMPLVKSKSAAAFLTNLKAEKAAGKS